MEKKNTHNPTGSNLRFVQQSKVSNFFKTKENAALNAEPKDKEINSKKKSKLWAFFDKKKSSKLGKDVAICKLCAVPVSLGGSGRTANTSNLKHHLKRLHEAEYDNLNLEQEKESKYLRINNKRLRAGRLNTD